jgi:hypothetical protein
LFLGQASLIPFQHDRAFELIPVAIPFGINLALEVPTLWTMNLDWHSNWFDSSTGEIIADNLSKAGWSWGCVATVDSSGRTIWIADARRDAGNCFVVRGDEKPAAFVISFVTL